MLLYKFHPESDGKNHPSLVPSPSYTKREKGSGEKGRTTMSPCWKSYLANQIAVA